MAFISVRNVGIPAHFPSPPISPGYGSLWPTSPSHFSGILARRRFPWRVFHSPQKSSSALSPDPACELLPTFYPFGLLKRKRPGQQHISQKWSGIYPLKIYSVHWRQGAFPRFPPVYGSLGSLNPALLCLELVHRNSA